MSISCTRCGGSGREPDWRAFGAKIRRERERRGVGLRELARHVGCSPAFISDIEHGRRGGGLAGEKTQAILRWLRMTTAPGAPEEGVGGAE